ncbi:type II secretion system minor pseudopilin [Halodesulfovibrio marinisediminis]|uniref:Type II secretory pathway, component PulK n=1 Tax=Halodesulfovibrio marinisediminis DSM 17456 TaxID=1121457 RepID=A0A1N6GZQ7_9BACT|nr:type II secretion system protein GspK [Halodesulfovibrio marinisediminis]SIO12989.1 Type II secretory pathway, component PulK [Halodesulfovibrio marinisediminis DSM 17456]
MPSSTQQESYIASPERGSIVVIVLIVLSALAVLAVELSKEILTDYASSTYLQSTVAGYALFDSGKAIACDVLKKDYKNSKADHQFEEWGKVNEVLVRISNEFESGDISGIIRDENSLFPINRITSPDTTDAVAYREILLRLLTQLCHDLDIHHGKPQDFLDAIRIWQGEELPDAISHDIWYQTRSKPYERPKKKLISPEELLLIYWPNAQLSDVERLYYGSKDVKGLHDLITVWGNGPINMNTACPEIISAIPTEQRYRAAFLKAATAFRNNSKNSFANNWYLPLAEDIGLSQKQIPTRALGVASDVFRISITVTIGGSELRECSIIKRTADEISTIDSFAN